VVVNNGRTVLFPSRNNCLSCRPQLLAAVVLLILHLSLQVPCPHRLHCSGTFKVANYGTVHCSAGDIARLGSVMATVLGSHHMISIV
jgi:hypothetical protein